MNPSSTPVPQPEVSPDTTQRMNELTEFARNNPNEFIRIFDQGKQFNDTPVSTPPQDLQMNQLIAALQSLTTQTHSRTTQDTPSVRRENLKVTPYDGKPDSLYRFISELTSKITLEKWTTESEKIIVAESLLTRGERADKLMDSYRVLGQTTISTFDEWKQNLIELCQDVGAQDKANRQLLDFHYDKSRHQSYAEFFAEFCVIAAKTSKSDASKYDQLVRGTPAWLRRLARPVPEGACAPHWRKLAHYFNQVFIEDDQIKEDDNRWKNPSSSNSKSNTRNTRNASQTSSAPTTTMTTAPLSSSSPTGPPPGDPMDLDAIRTPQQATQLVKGKKLNDWIRQVCNRFNLCLFCREAGHRVKECTLSTKVHAIDTTTTIPMESENE
jgi:hypothetical protein